MDGSKLIYIVLSSDEDDVSIELPTFDLQKALDKKDEIVEKGCTYIIEVWENEEKLGSVYWDKDFGVFGGSTKFLELIRCHEVSIR
ncbi:hypothetical protein ACFQZE_06875 [Paenibacillus sp. GCM10027627]|uniref:hypothetical protein n=1 Tax=unclassified Paenibacillus TaxID=185978 RepID=UPI00362A2DC0